MYPFLKNDKMLTVQHPMNMIGILNEMHAWLL